MPDQLSQLRRLIAERLGVLPNFFCTAASAPGLIDRLWDFARSAYFDSPLPSLFKERLFVHLSHFCEVRYCIVRHVGFLIGHGHPAGDPDCPPQTIDQVVALLRRPVPDETAFADAIHRLLETEPTIEMPAAETQREADLFDALSLIFLEPKQSLPARQAVGRAFGDASLEMLIAFLAFIRTAHFWTEAHPDLEYEPDVLLLMKEHAQAETRCNGLRPLRLSWLRREVLPSMAITSGSPSRSSLIQARKQALNNSGSSAANTSQSVSWLGMPVS